MEGPFLILHVSGLNVVVGKGGLNITVNVNQIRPYYDCRDYPKLFKDDPGFIQASSTQIGSGSSNDGASQRKIHSQSWKGIYRHLLFSPHVPEAAANGSLHRKTLYIVPGLYLVFIDLPMIPATSGSSPSPLKFFLTFPFLRHRRHQFLWLNRLLQNHQELQTAPPLSATERLQRPIGTPTQSAPVPLLLLLQLRRAHNQRLCSLKWINLTAGLLGATGRSQPDAGNSVPLRPP